MTVGAVANDNDGHIINLRPYYYKHTITWYVFNIKMNFIKANKINV